MKYYDRLNLYIYFPEIRFILVRNKNLMFPSVDVDFKQKIIALLQQNTNFYFETVSLGF